MTEIQESETWAGKPAGRDRHRVEAGQRTVDTRWPNEPGLNSTTGRAFAGEGRVTSSPQLEEARRREIEAQTRLATRRQR